MQRFHPVTMTKIGLGKCLKAKFVMSYNKLAERTGDYWVTYLEGQGPVLAAEGVVWRGVVLGRNVLP